MIKVDLITGFLGAGKTTFLKKYAGYFIKQGKKVGILENDYGAVNVDMLLLNELRGDNCELEMVAGACDDDCHKRRFKTKLISMGMSGYDRVIIEPSGIFDVDEFFDSLREDPLDRWYEIGNVITIVDAKLEEELSEISDFYLASQVANAGCIMLSKSQLATEDEVEAAIEHLKRASLEVKCKRDIDDIVIKKDWNELDDSDFAKISTCGYELSSYVKKKLSKETEYSTIYYLEHGLNMNDMKEKIPQLFDDSQYGKIFRVKGFFKEEDGSWYEINSTKKESEINKIKVGQEVIIVIGSDINKENIDRMLGIS